MKEKLLANNLVSLPQFLETTCNSSFRRRHVYQLSCVFSQTECSGARWEKLSHGNYSDFHSISESFFPSSFSQRQLSGTHTGCAWGEGSQNLKKCLLLCTWFTSKYIQSLAMPLTTFARSTAKLGRGGAHILVQRGCSL